MKPTYQQLESELALSELARTEQREELTEAYDYIEMVQDMNNKLHTVLEINNIKLEFEGELH